MFRLFKVCNSAITPCPFLCLFFICASLVQVYGRWLPVAPPQSCWRRLWHIFLKKHQVCVCVYVSPINCLLALVKSAWLLPGYLGVCDPSHSRAPASELDVKLPARWRTSINSAWRRWTEVVSTSVLFIILLLGTGLAAYAFVRGNNIMFVLKFYPTTKSAHIFRKRVCLCRSWGVPHGSWLQVPTCGPYCSFCSTFRACACVSVRKNIYKRMWLFPAFCFSFARHLHSYV